MTGYFKKFNENVTMSFRVNNKHLLGNYNKIWGKVEKLMRIDFESKHVYDDDDTKYIKTKIKIYAGSMVTNFHNISLLTQIKNIILKNVQKNANMCKKR